MLSAFVSFLSLLFGYVLFLPQSITIDDSAQFSVAAHGLGVAQPTGYPLFSLFTKLFLFLPVGDIGFRVNLSGAFFEALAAGLLTLLARRYFSKAISFSLALFYAFSLLTWYNVQVAKVYPLHHFFFHGILLLALLTWEKRDARLFFFAAFLLGLGLTNHFTLLLLVPFLLLLFFQVFQAPFSLGLGAVFFFFLGFSLDLYLPLRAAAHPFLNWGDPERFLSFLQVLTKWQWLLAFQPKGALMPFVWKTGGLVFYMVENLTPLLAGFALWGAWGLWKNGKRELLWFFGGYALSLLLFGNAPKDQILRADFLLHPLLLVQLFCLGFFFTELRKRNLVLGLSGAIVFLWQWPLMQQIARARTLEYGRAILRTLPPRSLLVTENVQPAFYAWYVQEVEQKRRDVLVIPADFLPLPWGKRLLRARGWALPSSPKQFFFFHNTEETEKLWRELARANRQPLFVNRDGGDRTLDWHHIPWRLHFYFPQLPPHTVGIFSKEKSR